MWAEDAKGDDDLADVMQHKLLSLIRQSHLDNQAYHERQATKCEREMDKIAARGSRSRTSPTISSHRRASALPTPPRRIGPPRWKTGRRTRRRRWNARGFRGATSLICESPKRPRLQGFRSERWNAEAVKSDLEIRRIGQVRFITTDSFRCWLGEEVVQPMRNTEELSADSRAVLAAIDRRRRGIGMAIRYTDDPARVVTKRERPQDKKLTYFVERKHINDKGQAPQTLQVKEGKRAAEAIVEAHNRDVSDEMRVASSSARCRAPWSSRRSRSARRTKSRFRPWTVTSRSSRTS